MAELQKLLEAEARDHSVALDLNEVKRVDHDVVSFVANCEAKSIKLANCPAYIRDGFPVQGGQRSRSPNSPEKYCRRRKQT